MQTEKNTAIALVTGLILMAGTMILHPSGGNIEHMLSITRILVISHSLAILAVPFLIVGFWGTGKRIGFNVIVQVAFTTTVIGLLAGMLAATVNGIALPIFYQNFQSATPDIAMSIRNILRAINSLNQAFDFIFVGLMSIAMLLWSIAIIRSRALPIWIGYLGVMLALGAAILFASGHVTIDLHGFRIFIFANVLWIICLAVASFRLK